MLFTFEDYCRWVLKPVPITDARDRLRVVRIPQWVGFWGIQVDAGAVAVCASERAVETWRPPRLHGP